MGKSQCSFKVPPLSNADDTYSFSDQDKATSLNDYFCSISTIETLTLSFQSLKTEPRSHYHI